MTTHTPDTPIPADLREAAGLLLPAPLGLALLPGRDDLAKATAANGDWCVSRWPAGTTEARVAGAHAAMAAARGPLGPLVPAVAARPDGAGAAAHVGAHQFDAWSWLPGAPQQPTAARWPEPGDRVRLPGVLPDAAFADCVAAIGRLHAATEAGPRPAALPDLPLPGLVVSVRQAWAQQRGVLRPLAVRTPAVQRWLALGERTLPAAEALLEGASPALLGGRAVVHLGLWPGHALLADGRLSGLLGWEAAAWGAPLLDLAQAVVRLRGWSAAGVEVALAAYGDERRLDAEARRLLPAVGVLDLVASTGALLVAAHATGRPEQPPTALRVAIRGMVASLESAGAALAQASGTKKAPARRRGFPPRRPGPPRGKAPAPRKR